MVGIRKNRKSVEEKRLKHILRFEKFLVETTAGLEKKRLNCRSKKNIWFQIFLKTRIYLLRLGNFTEYTIYPEGDTRVSWYVIMRMNNVHVKTIRRLGKHDSRLAKQLGNFENRHETMCVLRLDSL